MTNSELLDVSQTVQNTKMFSSLSYETKVPEPQICCDFTFLYVTFSISAVLQLCTYALVRFRKTSQFGCFGRHVQRWRSSEFLSLRACFGFHESRWKCPQFSLNKYPKTSAASLVSTLSNLELFIPDIKSWSLGWWCVLSKYQYDQVFVSETWSKRDVHFYLSSLAAALD